MIVRKLDERVKFGAGHRLSGKIVGHGTMKTPGGAVVLTYAILLDEQFQGYIGDEDHPNESFVSTMLVHADGVVPKDRVAGADGLGLGI